MPFGEAPKPRGRPRLVSSDYHALNKSELSRVNDVTEEEEAAAELRRKPYESNPEKWLKYYLAHSYARPFERPHKEIIAGAVRARNTRGRFVVAAERGIGKSAVLWGLVLYFKLTRREPYPVCVPWADKALKRAFRFWKNAICINELIARDYPKFCKPFVHAKGVPQRVATTRWRGTDRLTGAQLTVGEGIIVFPDLLGCIGGSTINGNIRGLNLPQEDGSILRPSLVLLDDVQDRKTAKSSVQVDDTVATIDSDIGGSGESGRDLPMLMACNCICRNDVSEHYLTHPEWKALRVPCVESWPDGWADEKSECRKLWDEWYEKFRDGKGDLTFYRKNKKAMTHGMKLTAPAAFKGAEKCPDAFYGVMRMYFRMGREAFMAERQQDPQAQTTSMYRLDAETILSRVSGFARLEAPVGSVLCCGVDLNYVGLNWCVVAADGLSRSRKVVAHGIWPGGAPLIQKGATVDQACAILRRAIGLFGVQVLAAIRVRCGDKQRGLDAACFDCSMGAWQDACVAAIREARLPVPCWPIKAFGEQNYRTQKSDLQSGKGWRVTEWPRLGRVLVINSDYWWKITQQGFLVEPTEAGALSLYSPDPNRENVQLAREVAGHILEEHVRTEKNDFYKWSRTVGVTDDRADSLVYACALTGAHGIGEDRATKPHNTRRIRHVKV